MVELKGKTCTVRSFRKGDEKLLFANLNDEDVVRYLSTLSYPPKVINTKRFVHKNAEARDSVHKGGLHFAIQVGDDVAGSIGFKNIDNHKAEIGYWLGKKYWGKGIMTESVGLVTEFGFKRLNLKRIYAAIFSQNKPSMKVLEKNGYKIEGIHKKDYCKDGKCYDAVMYAKVI